MRTVIFVLAAIVAVNAQSSCVRTPVYTEKIDPINCPKAGIQLPNYENAQTYYQCAKVGGTGTLTTCPNSGYFSYVMQNCASCDSYIPSTTCSALPFKATCVPIGATTPGATTPGATTPGATTPAVTTPAPTTPGGTTAAVTTAAPTTTAGVPQPPTDPGTGTTAAGDTPSGTTIFIPQPPSPGESNVPTPVTPVPTAPNLDPTPPSAPEAPATK